MEKIKAYLEANKDRFLQELIGLLEIPSISADPKYTADVARAAAYIHDRFADLKMARTEIFQTAGHPIVYSETIQDPSKPTLLVYGHYDVQPPDPLNLWTSPPFQPVIKDEKIYARGSCDDKGQVYMHFKAMEILNSLGALPCNVKFVVEGEEECGSVNLEGFLRAHKEMLRCDAILVSDTSMIANDTPSLTVSLRGLAYMEVEVTGPNRDLHSGVYGGAVCNPCNVLCEMIASLKDANQRITIPGFYDDVIELTADERDAMAQRPFDKVEYCKDLGIADTRGENGYSIIEQVSIRPTLDVNGMWGGYTGDGAKTVLPSKAFAKISMRLVPNQNSGKISALFAKHFESIAPPAVKVKVTALHGGEGAMTPTDSIAYKAAMKAMEESFGPQPIPTREGGSIPIIAMFKEILGADTALMGFGLDSDNIHSPNEHYGLFNFYKGIETIPRFHYHFAEMFQR